MEVATIQYQGINPFSGIAPTPLVGRTENMIQVGERLVVEETITLHGTITGGCERPDQAQYQSLINSQNSLVAAFGSDYQNFKILDIDGSLVLNRDAVRVASINFPTNNYGSFDIYLPFDITLQCYPSGYGERDYSGAIPWNVLNPVHEVEYQEGEDGIITIDVTTSAKGLNTSSNGTSNALQNAITWAETYLNWRPPNIASIYPNMSAPCLRSESEILNRYDGSYQLRQTYVADTLGKGPGITRYTTTYSYDFNEGISTIEINGSIEGCIGPGGTSIETLRQQYAIIALQAPTFAINTLYDATGRRDLNFNPLAKSVTEDTDKIKITFSFTFNDDLRPLISYDYKVSFDYDYETDAFTASIIGEVTSRVPLTSYTNYTVNNKWQGIEQYVTNLNLYNIVQGAYNTYLNSIGISFADYPLNKIPISTTQSDDYNNFKMELGAEFKTQQFYLPVGFYKFDYTLQFTPALEQYKEFPCLDQNGIYQVFDLGYQTRATCAIQVNGVIDDPGTQSNAIAAIKTQMDLLSAQNFVGTRMNLDNQRYSTSSSSFDRAISASATYSAEQIAFSFGTSTMPGGGNLTLD